MEQLGQGGGNSQDLCENSWVGLPGRAQEITVGQRLENAIRTTRRQHQIQVIQ